MKEGKCRVMFVARQFAGASKEGEYYAPTPGGEVQRIMLATSLMLQLSVAVLDFSAAFMHTPISEETWVWPPAHVDDTRSTVWRLLKGLNGLRCSGRDFGEYLAEVLEELGCRG